MEIANAGSFFGPSVLVMLQLKQAQFDMEKLDQHAQSPDLNPS